jgi:hypothetical protein
MRKFDPDKIVATVELQQMVVDYCHELDVNGGINVTQYFTEDCLVDVGAIVYRGHAAMRQHYDDHREFVRKEYNNERVQGHGFTNLKIEFHGKDRATLTYLVVNFSAPGKAPIFNATTPTIITDCRFECRLEADGHWRIAEFYGAPIFVGNDPYLNKAVVGG